MLRPSSSRYHRNKGLKVKHALQIGLLLAVCFWLLYQLKHSHDKKKAFDETNKFVENVEGGHEVLKFGRKDLNEGFQMPMSKTTERDGEVERGGEKEEEEEDDIKHEESEDTMIVRGNDDTNRQHQQKLHEEQEFHYDFGNVEDNDWRGRAQDIEDKDIGADDENKKTRIKEEIHEIKENPLEAQEAHYNGDNVSSAMLKDDIKLDSVHEDMSKSDEKLKEDPPHSNGFAVESKMNATANFGLVQNENGSSTITEIVQDIPEAHEKQFSGDGATHEVKVDLMSVGETEDITKSNEKKTEIPEINSLEDAHKENSTLDFTSMKEHIVSPAIVEAVQSPLLNVTEMGEKTDETRLSRMENGTSITSVVENVYRGGEISLAKPDNGTLFNSTLMESSDHIPEGSNMTQSNAGTLNSTESNENSILSPAEQNRTSKVGILAGETNHSDTTVTEGEEQTVIHSPTGAIKEVNQISGTEVKDNNGTSEVNQNSTVSFLEAKDDFHVSVLSQNSTTSILAEEVKDEKHTISTPDVPSEEALMKINDSNTAIVQEMKEPLTDLGTLPETEIVSKHTEDAVAD